MMEALIGIPAAVASLPQGIECDGSAPASEVSGVREVPSWLLDRVLHAIEKVNVRARRNSLPEIDVKVGEPYVRDVSRCSIGVEPPRLVEFVKVEVIGKPVKIPGWSLEGRVDFEDGMVLVNARPGGSIPDSYRNASPMCEHCRVARDRKAIFVFEGDDGRYLQVGRSCLQDFMGMSPESALWAASAWSGVIDDIDALLGEADPSDRPPEIVRLDDVMVASAYVVRVSGFFSKKMVEERGGVASSSDVWDVLFDSKARAKYAPSADDKEKAAAVIAWVRESWGSLSGQSDYQYNAVQLCSQEHVRVKRIGLLVSLVAAYDRDREERVKREALVNAHVGEVGQRREFRAKYLGMNSFESAFGWMCIARFASPEGLLVYKGGNVWWPAESKAGDELVFVGSIKEHSDYKGMKQSMVARCVMGPAKVKAKASRAKKAA